MWSIRSSLVALGLRLYCGFAALPSLSAGEDVHGIDSILDAANEALALRKPMMRHEKADSADTPLANPTGIVANLGGKTVHTGSKIRAANDLKAEVKKALQMKKAAKSGKKSATEIVEQPPENLGLSSNEFWKQRLQVIKTSESKLAEESLQPGQMDLMKVLDAVVPVKHRSKAVASFGRNMGLNTESDGSIVPLIEKLGYTGLISQVSKAIDLKNNPLHDQLRKANRSKKVFFTSNEHISPDGAADLLQRAGVSHDLDILKIDIDSYDLALLRGILKQNFEPKIVIMEMNSDLAPPINWFLDYHSEFVFKDAAASHGLYGASPDALYEELSVNHKYSLIGISMENGRHDMWFVKNSLVRTPANANQPLVSWRGMVRMFWSQTVGQRCAYIPHDVYSCPLNFLRQIYREAKGKMPLDFRKDSWAQMADISVYLANPNFQKKDAPYGYVTLLNRALLGECGTRREFCPTVFKVTRDPSLKVTMHDDDDEDDDSLIALEASRHDLGERVFDSSVQ